MTISADDLPELEVGAVVKVYRAGPSSPIWFHDAVTGRCTDVFSAAGFEFGRVQAVRRGRRAADDLYQVTVIRGGRVLYVNWRSRRWVRLPDEGSPYEGN